MGLSFGSQFFFFSKISFWVKHVEELLNQSNHLWKANRGISTRTQHVVTTACAAGAPRQRRLLPQRVTPRSERARGVRYEYDIFFSG